MVPNNTWLVTGAAGFIGSHLCEKLLKLNQKVIGLDDLSTGQKSNIEYLNNLGLGDNFKFVLGDIRDQKLCRELVSQSEYVLHQAALASVPQSILEPERFHSVNVDGFINMLQASLDFKIKRFVYASSSAVYGDNETLPKKEDDVGKPLSPYAATKAIDEVYGAGFFKVYGAPTIGLRYFNVYGPRQNPEGPYAAVICNWLNSMLNDEPIFINGDGSFTRDFCYVGDVVEANLKAAFAGDEALGLSYNIGFGEKTTLIELYSTLKSVVEAEVPGLKVRDVEFKPERSGDIPHSYADISLAKNKLLYSPKFNLHEGLRQSIQELIKLT